MTQYNSLNVKLSNSQLNKFKSAIKNETEVVLRLSSNMIGDNEVNFPHQLLLTNTQVSTFLHNRMKANKTSDEIWRKYTKNFFCISTFSSLLKKFIISWFEIPFICSCIHTT